MPGEIRLVRLGNKGEQEQGNLYAPILSTTPPQETPLFGVFDIVSEQPINFSELYNKLAYVEVNNFEDNMLQHFKTTQSNIGIIEKKAKEWAPPTIVVIPPQVCGGGASYNEIIKHLREKSSELEIHAIYDSNDNDFTDRCTSSVAKDYLNLLLCSDELDFMLNQPENTPPQQLILLAYSSAFPIAVEIQRKFSELGGNNNIIRVVALDPTPKNYFNKNNEELATLLLQVIRSFLRKCATTKGIHDKPFWKEADLGTVSSALDKILPRLLLDNHIQISGLEEPLASFFTETQIVGTIVKLCEEHYNLKSVQTVFPKAVRDIVVNFLALYQWYTKNEDSLEIRESCKETMMITAEQSLSSQDAKGSRNNPDNDCCSKTLQWDGITNHVNISGAQHRNLLSMFSPEVADCVHQYWLVQQRKQIEAFLKNTADPDLSFQIILNQIDTELQHYTHEDEEDEFELTREELCQKYQEAFARQEKLNIERIDAEAKLAAQALVNRNTWGPGLSPVMKKSSSSEIRHTPLYEFRYRTT